MLLLISLLFMGIGFILSMVLKSKFKKYAQVPLLAKRHERCPSRRYYAAPL